MDADTVLRIRPMLTEYLHEFDGCMGRITSRVHLQTYVSGQLSDLNRKSVERIADGSGARCIVPFRPERTVTDSRRVVGAKG